MAGQSVGGAGLADRYATALFELALERDAIEQIERDLEAIRALVDGSDDLARVVRSLTLTRTEQGKALDAVLERLGSSQYVRNFVALLARNRRVFLLTDMIAAFQAKLAELAAALDLTVLLVEQNLRFIQALAERVLIMQKGAIVATIAPDQLSDQAIVDEYLGI